ncbi:hypothetical protein ACFVXC_00355 [Streptomyces sp. NPDC058257]|uniref:hypothetical protein n=1 Tax=Streptomyces sp. NPDC058257 TaxID=3346409 RepID=UPI0036E32FC2
MNDDTEQQPHTANPGYVVGQLAKAFATALTHRDPDTRRRAEERVEHWRAVLAGMASGRLTIGSRKPVEDLPAWVTPQVVRGGFATGAVSAGGPLQPYETEAARRFGVPADRRALFACCLSEPGLTWLFSLLDDRRYEVTVPEEAALLTVAWLARSGDGAAALDLVSELEPFADRLRFLPRPADRAVPDVITSVHRRTVADTAATLARRRPNTAVETQHEALTVWQPFGDELLTLWLETAGPGRVLDTTPDADCHRRGTALLARYHQLAAEHRLCGKHRSPKENLSILRTALEDTLTGRPLDARRLGLLQHAAESMVRRRGTPGSPPHHALRHRQARQTALPSHYALAHLVMRRCSELPQGEGVSDTGLLIAEVSEQEYRETGLPAGTAIPASIRWTVEAALSAPLSTLVERSVVPSAEVMAELVPQFVAVTTAHQYSDASLRTLMSANYRAFRNRRSLLLLNLERQVRTEELPWVRALSGQRGDATGSGRSADGSSETGTGQGPALIALRQLGELAVQGFPGTILPNPLVRELGVLAHQADLKAPFVEELAADIFMGSFTPKFLKSARVAAELLGGTLYERYYGIDYAALRNLAIIETSDALNRSYGARTSPGFAKLCVGRATGTPRPGASADFWSVAASGMVIEQSQILTTHNLAVLARHVGISPDWPDLARRAFVAVCRLTARVHDNPRPLRTVKDAAYAWRQMLFHISRCTPAEQAAFLASLDEEVARHPAHVAPRLAPALVGLHQVAAGGAADTGTGRRFLGWSAEGHWMVAGGSGP